ncbi:diacylglycerol kinase family protein [Chitinophaga polysaccharea]|uniref:diacylglycerol kinase family protein n=1 Tax=Chitinophaga TaxID=79328 RepID=UPI00145576F9|nr:MULTISPECIES: diacylglycerol kinase family protein [Chitinophaga]NLR61536.1 diacylglycerol kinase family protein [Chitinophaga polysaccharea]NLU93869.1 diacylglycerol kinase family protein [Chitinophaga sp. Ak27]
MENSYISKRIASFGYAWNGIVAFVRSEPHARIHVLATIVVVAAACWYRITAPEWIWTILAIALVWTTEMLNTVVEKMMDHLSPQLHPHVKFIKDVAAGAVLVAAIAAAIIGAVIFIPHIF